jgi:chloride channel protein, CIC family
MTGGYALIVPLMIVSVISYLLLGETSLYEKQVPSRVDSPAHTGDFAVDILEHISVKEALPLGRRVESIPEGMPFEEMMQLIANSNQQDFPVLNESGQLTGIVSLTDMRKVMLERNLHQFLIAKDIATEGVLTVTPGDSLKTALRKMTEAEIRELPVVSDEDSGRVISMLSRKDIIQAYHDEIERLKVRRTNHLTG